MPSKWLKALRSHPLLSLAIALAASTASAVPFEDRADDGAGTFYGSYADPFGWVEYQNVRDIGGHLGAPTVSLNSLDFTPSDRMAECSVCPEGVLLIDAVSFDLRSSSGRELEELHVNLLFEYYVASFDPKGSASVTVAGLLAVESVEIDGRKHALDYTIPAFIEPEGRIRVDGFGSESGLISASLRTVPFTQIAASMGFTGSVTGAQIRFETKLHAANAGIAGFAHINSRDMDFFSGSVGIPLGPAGIVTPEPSTALLLLGGLTVLAPGGLRRRSDAKIQRAVSLP